MRFGFVAIGVLLLGLLTGFDGKRGASVNPSDAVAIHAVVQRQLSALLSDDEAGAFDAASADARAFFGSASNFLQAMKTYYSPIYRHRYAHFSKARTVGKLILQPVRVTASDSSVWLAVYRMEREAGGNWKIDGCQLLPTGNVSI
jgi:hypothetical protein